MNRRGVLAGLGSAVAVSGCGWGAPSVTRRFAVIAQARVDGVLVEGRTVMEGTWSRVTKSLMGAGRSITMKGEALILDLKGKGTVFVLPYVHDTTGSFTEIYETQVLFTIGSGESLTDRDFERIKAAQGRLVVARTEGSSTGLPLFVAFEDERVPRTIYEVDPNKLGDYFPGAEFVELFIEFTNEPVTKLLEKRLPWVSNKNAGFDIEPAGPGRRPSRDRPLSYKMNTYRFFALGNLK